MILRLTRVKFRPELATAAAAVFAARTREVGREPGCRGARFVVSESPGREGMALSYWDDVAQYHAHEQTEAYHRFAAIAYEYLAGEPDIAWWRVVEEGEAHAQA